MPNLLLQKQSEAIVDKIVEFSRFRRGSLFNYIHSNLVEIFTKELNHEDSIFVRVKRGAVTKISFFLANQIPRPTAIGIAGETASGKSTISNDVIDMVLGFAERYGLGNVITRVNTDDYYLDKSQEVIEAGGFSNFAKNYDFDVPQAFDLSLMKRHIAMLLSNEEVYLPSYDMSGTARRIDNVTLTEPSKVIITEGLFTLTDDISSIFDLTIYVEVSESIQAERFFRRAQERDLGESASEILRNAKEKAEIFIKPALERADLVLSGEVNRLRYKEFVDKVLELVENAYAIRAKSLLRAGLK